MTGPSKPRPEAPLLFVASSGGHLVQLGMFARSLDDDRVWVSFRTADAVSALRAERVVWAYFPTNRSLVNLVKNTFLAFRVMRSIRPRVIVTTGAGVAVPFAYVGALFGVRTIYVESFARITSPSLTGRLIHPIAYRFFVQWPNLLSAFKKAEYRGTLV